MLNDYRIFDYRIKYSFSFLFVTHSILGFWKYRVRVIVKECTVQAKLDLSNRRSFLATRCEAAQVCPSPPLPVRPTPKCPTHTRPPDLSAPCTSLRRPQHSYSHTQRWL